MKLFIVTAQAEPTSIDGAPLARACALSGMKASWSFMRFAIMTLLGD